MNIFEHYLIKIKNIISDLNKKGYLDLPDNLDGITAEIPPSKFNSDISTNVAMFLSKINKKNSLELAEVLAKALKLNDSLIEKISVIQPGFINIKFKPIFWTNFIQEIVQDPKNFGKNITEKKKKLFN